jgi:hypothetical protein
MTHDQIKDAIKQMIVACDLKMEAYEPVSARSVLYELGYSMNHTVDVLRYIADHGFDYCLDYAIRMTGHHDASGEFPNQQVCYWGPDQLKSRLQCLRS